MKTMMIMLLALGVVASASTVPCSGGVADVTTLTAGNVCTVGNQTIGNASVTFNGLTSVDIGITGAEEVGDFANLDFSILTNPDPVPSQAWVSLIYQITAPGPWIDAIQLTNTDGNGVWIYEQACTGPIVDINICSGTVLGHAAAGPVGSYQPSDTEALSSAVSSMYVQKWIAYGDPSISRFTNGVGEAPEPGTITIGGGLLLIGVLLRRKAKR